MKYIPIFLDLSKIKIVIFGGGKVALRKLDYLEGADITVVSEKFMEDFLKRDVKMISKKIESKEDINEYIKDADLVIIATSDKNINSLIMKECEEKRKIFNLVDDKKSKAIFPAYHNENGIIMAISTSGKAPSLATFIRDRLSPSLKEYSKALDLIERIRNSLDSHDEEKRKKFFRSLFNEKIFWDMVKEDNFIGAYEFAIKLWREKYVPD
ncbi:MAG: precorrin-2 dehydrogenase/sirohydrochlorin ferrochelatase family protein [Thermoplasmata archaeon]|nr:bifunctional precorrin-2 dehydrogenase/sirohydrochlorin ferrochelatase [Thermoplasmata archaeon]